MFSLMKFCELKNLLVSFTLLLIAFSCESQSISRTKTERLEKFVDTLVQPLIDRAEIAGIAVGVMRNDSILLLKSYGYADLEFNVPLPVNASFEIGSITKQFTAVAIMQLVEKGFIKLDDKISEHLYFNLKEEITIRQLLTHTSGIKEHQLGDMVYHDYPKDTLLRLVEKKELDFKPGIMMMYNNTGYKILGLLIEKITGQTYEEYITGNFFEKLNMTNSYLADLETIKKFRAHGYNNIRKDGKLTRAEQPHFYWTFSAGGLSSTTEDLLKWIQALHQSEILMKKESYHQLIAAGQLIEGISLRYAMGLQVLNYKGYDVIGHGGSGSGILCDSRYFPDQNLTIVTLQNTYRRASESEISYSIADKLLPLKSRIKKKFEGDLSRYKGVYNGILQVTVDIVDSELVIKKPGQTTGDTLYYIGDQKWLLGTDEYSFKEENGKVKEMHWNLISAHFILEKK